MLEPEPNALDEETIASIEEAKLNVTGASAGLGKMFVKSFERSISQTDRSDAAALRSLSQIARRRIWSDL